MKTVLFDYQDMTKNGIGGKARNLKKIMSLDVNIPRWAVIPEDVMMAQLNDANDVASMDEKFDQLAPPPGILTELASFFGSEHQSKTYAARSSAIDEDGDQFSFAGQFETYLHVPFSQIEEKIKCIWRSAVSDRALRYRKENNLKIHMGIAVIIQEMIHSDVAGVAFGADPVTGDQQTKVISSVYGLGEGLVSGDLDADTYTLSGGKVIKEQLACKTHAYGITENGFGITKVEVHEDQQNLSSLSKSQLSEISGILNTLATSFGTPQDIEFAFSGSNLYLLQTRPITATGNRQKGEYILWDNSNIIESYPGVTTPLTFSFIIKMYEMVYRQFVGLMGVTNKEIERNADVFAQTLGLVRGRVYYNLLNWYKMLAMLPGYSINAGFMEGMMGVKERFDLEDKHQMSKGLAWFRIVLMIIKMLFLQRRLPKERNRFLNDLNSTIKKYKEVNFEALGTEEIIVLYNRFEKELLLKWKAPLINDFFAMIWFGVLQKSTKNIFPDEESIHNDLLCGSNDIISVEPIHKSMHIAGLVHQNTEALSLFSDHSPDEVWARMVAGECPDVKAAIDQYLDQFGERCVGELKLETVSYSQNPALFVKVIQSYVGQGITQPKKTTGIEESLRESAEMKLSVALKNRPVKRLVFRYVLNKARDLVSNRENLRYERTRAFGIVRVMFSALGKHLYQAGKLEHARDVFYLELDEIKALEKITFDSKLASKISERKSEFEQYKKQPPPQERFYTYGMNFTDEYIHSNEKMEAISGDLSGIGCCPGRVQGRVRVVSDPGEINSLDGDILVTSSTDPGWVTLFPTASGIIVERGSLLSHSAIVSREMGIPCIVSVSGLLRTLKTGDEVIMDGSSGKISIISNDKTAS